MRVMSSYGFVSTRIGMSTAGDAVEAQTSFSRQHTSVSRLSLFGLSAFLSDSVGGSAPGMSGAVPSGIVLRLEDGSHVLSAPAETLYMYGSGDCECLSGLGPDDGFYREFKGVDENGDRVCQVTRYSASLSGDSRIWMLVPGSRPSEIVDLDRSSGRGPTMWLVVSNTAERRRERIAFSIRSVAKVGLDIPGREGERTFYAAFPVDGDPGSTFVVAQDSVVWVDRAARSSAPESGRVFSLGSLGEGTRGVTAEGGTSRSDGKLARTGAGGKISPSLVDGGGGSSDVMDAIATEQRERDDADKALSKRMDDMASDNSVNMAKSSDLTALRNRVAPLESGLSAVSGRVGEIVGEAPSGVSLKTLSDDVDSIRNGEGQDVTSLKTLSDDVDSIRNGEGQDVTSLKTLSDRISGIVGEGSGTAPSLRSLESGVSSARSAVAAVESSVSGVASRVTNVETGIGSINSAISRITGPYSSGFESLAELTADMDGLKESVASSVASLDDLDDRVSSMASSAVSYDHDGTGLVGGYSLNVGSLVLGMVHAFVTVPYGDDGGTTTKECWIPCYFSGSND